MVDQATSHKPKKQRSPSYPAIGLKTALERARKMFKEEGRNFAPVDAILHDWGYRPGSGAGLVALAALKKYGLLAEQGAGPSRQAKLSDDALRIILDERPGSPERERLIHEAALKPTIHRQLWEKSGGRLGSDASLRHELLVERGFTEQAVRDFIPQFRATLDFAGLSAGATVESAHLDKGKEISEEPLTNMIDNPPPPLDSSGTQARAMQLPLAPDEYATIQARFPMTEQKWTQMLAVLEAMKPALVSTPVAGKTAAQANEVDAIGGDDQKED